MTPTEAFKQMERDMKTAFKEECIGLYGEIVESTPEDTGDMKADWQYEFKDSFHFRAKNNMEYAGIIASGRFMHNGKWYGSMHLPFGYYPMVRDFADNLERKLDGI